MFERIRLGVLFDFAFGQRMESLNKTLLVCGVQTDLSFLVSGNNRCIECVKLRILKTKNISQINKNLPVIDSLPITPYTTTNIYCRCGPRSSTPKKNRQMMSWTRPISSPAMQSLGKSLHDEPAKTDMPSAVKGILTLLFCIVYAAVLFIAAAIGSRVLTSFSTSVVSSGGKMHSWELTECKKHKHFRQRTVRFGN